MTLSGQGLPLARDGNHNGHTSPYEPSDAIPAAARYLHASGAPADHRRIFAGPGSPSIFGHMIVNVSLTTLRPSG